VFTQLARPRLDLLSRFTNESLANGPALVPQLFEHYGRRVTPANLKPSSRVKTVRMWSALAAAIVTGALMVPASAMATSSRVTGPYYYLSIGDSLAEGWQPVPADATLHGYSDQVVTDLASHIPLTLVNYGCGGATTSTALFTNGCTTGGEAEDGTYYPTTTQIGAAVAFAQAHPGQVMLISISLGANDYGGCLVNSRPTNCLTSRLASMKTNLSTIASDLRSTVGQSVPIIAITDNANDMEHYLRGPAGRISARDWLNEFKTVIVPTLQEAYSPSNVTLVNILSDIGSFIPWTREVKYPPYGKIPLALARTCQLTWECSSGNTDEHPNSAGYTLMAREIAAAYVQITK
jgi:lysophospholipase L1-like esterase